MFTLGDVATKPMPAIQAGKGSSIQAQAQTDEYSLARMKEMYGAILRLPSPGETEAAQARLTGTCVHQVDIQWTQNVPPSSASV